MERRRIAGWTVPSIGDVLFVSIFLRTLSMGNQLLGDGDTGWHIITGESIIGAMRVPRMDILSHTAYGTPWTTHAWLSEVLFAWLNRLMGLNGLVLAASLVISLTFFFLYKYMLYRRVGPVTAAMFTVLAASVSSVHWLVRPHIFSFGLTLAFIAALDIHQRGSRSYLKYLPLLMVIWVNLYGGFALGLVLISLYLAGNTLVWAVSAERRAASAAKATPLAITLAAALAASLVNPNGPRILTFSILFPAQKYITENILDWRYPDFHVMRAFEFMLLFYFAVFVLSRKKPDLFELLIAGLFLHMSLFATRFVPLFAIAVTPMAAVRLADAVDGILERVTGPAAEVAEGIRIRLSGLAARIASMEARLDGRHVWLLVTVAVVFVIGLGGGMVGEAKVMDYRFQRWRFPVDAMDFAMKNGIKGRMFNNDSWGGYILYRSYPRYRVFFDGRTDMYGEHFLDEYLKVSRVRLGFEDVLDRYKVDWVLYDTGSPLCRILEAGGGWYVVYSDKTAEILLRDTPANRGLIERYPHVKLAERH